MEKVVVLMSTYNGEKYLREQIESILNQSYLNCELVIRDDGSTDKTVEIIKEYDVTWFQGENLKPAQSFLELIKKAPKADFYALADQDDVWDRDKISIGIHALKAQPKEVLALYCSAIRVVDHQLKPISSVNYSTHRKVTLGESYVQTIAPGCTFIFNQATQVRLKNFHSENLMMHDSLIMNVVSAFGQVIYDKQPHMSYRQHENNVIGSPKSPVDKVIRTWTHTFFPKVPNFRYRMALAMEENYGEFMDEQTLRLTRMITGYKKSLLSKLKLAFDPDIKMKSKKSNALLILQVLSGKL